MLARLNRAGLIWPTMFTALGLAILVSLGIWQLQRKAWKEALILDIETRAKLPALSLADAEAKLKTDSLEDLEFHRLEADGTFLHDKERFLFTHKRALGAGYDVYTPLLVGAKKVIWANRGFVREDLRAFEKRRPGQVAGNIRAVGRIRLAQKPSLFIPQNDADQNTWYWRDLEGMHRSAFGDENVAQLPFFLEIGDPNVLGKSGPEVRKLPEDQWPKPGASVVKIVNRHFEYALTWFGLAMTLLGVYAVFAVGRWRKTSG